MANFNRKWTPETLPAEALKYQHRVHFKKGTPAAYKAARQFGLLDKICAHMIPLGNRKKRLIYTAINGKNIYIGLAGNWSIRLSQHKTKSPLKVRELFLDPKTVITKSEFMEPGVASVREKNLIQQYQQDPNWNCINEKIGGGLGGSEFVWDDASVEETILGKTKKWIEENAAGAWEYVKRSPRREHFKSLVIFERRRGPSFEKDAYPFEILIEEVRGKSQTDLSTAVATALYRHPRKKELLVAMKPRQRNKYSLEELIDLCRGKRSKELTSGVRSAMETHPQRDQIHAVMIRPKSKISK